MTKYEINNKGNIHIWVLLFAFVVALGFVAYTRVGKYKASVIGTVATAQSAGGTSLRFYGNGVRAPQKDRVKIPVNNPVTTADVGTADFTIEWWMKGLQSDNASANCTSGGDSWINGNIIIDRDIYGGGDYGDFGISIYGGRVAFGVHNGSYGDTLCSSTSVLDGTWKHVAVTRSVSTGQMRIYVDGVLSGSLNGPTGNISYRDARTSPYPNDPFLVLGAEKHDAGSSYPSYNGEIDELRISTVVRYSSNFSRPSQPFVSDASTAVLYHFDEGSGGVVTDSVGNATGSILYGGSPAGPVYLQSTVPFGSVVTPTPTPTPVPTVIPTPTSTPTPIPTATSTPVPTATPTPTPVVSGRRSVDFDGTNDVLTGGRIQGAMGSNFTIELWVKPDTTSQNSILVSQSDDTAGWSVELNGGRATFWSADVSGQWRSVRNTTALRSGTWYHVAVVNRVGSTRVYVNGAQGPAVSMGSVTSGVSFAVGGLVGYPFFDGQIDELRISNIARYTAAFTRPTTSFAVDSGVLALYKLDGGAGQVALDSSANGYTLTFGNTTSDESVDPRWSTLVAPIN